jgi:hypothetical protein
VFGPIALADRDRDPIRLPSMSTEATRPTTRLAESLAGDVHVLLGKRPDLAVTLLCDGASELWNLLRAELNEESLGRDTDPAFDHYAALPIVEHEAGAITVIVGEHAGVRHDARKFSPLVGLDVAVSGGALRLPLEPEFEHAVVVVSGRVSVAGAPLPVGTLRYLGTRRTALDLDADAGARLLVLGGEPLREPVLMWWNFVARTHDEVVQMRRDWADGRRFGDVPDSELPPIPAPDLG